MESEFDRKALRSRERLVLVGMVTTFLSLIPTVYAAAVSNSIVLLADLLRCTAEFLAILISWLILRRMLKTDRVAYNFGFGKLEQIANVAVASALLFTFLVSLISAIQRFISPVVIEGTLFGFLFALLSVIGNCLWWGKNYLVNRSSPSPVIDAQARLFRAKAFATTVVAVSLGVPMLVGSGPWTVYLDPVGSLILASFVLYSAYVMASHAMPDLVDRAVDESIQMLIMEVLIEHEKEYLELVRIRSRRSGNRPYVDIFLLFDGELQLKLVQHNIEIIKKALEEKLPGAVIGVIPSANQAS